MLSSLLRDHDGTTSQGVGARRNLVCTGDVRRKQPRVGGCRFGHGELLFAECCETRVERKEGMMPRKEMKDDTYIYIYVFVFVCVPRKKTGRGKDLRKEEEGLCIYVLYACMVYVVLCACACVHHV